jgi:tetratricopeptide (TPR) repeat protein
VAASFSRFDTRTCPCGAAVTIEIWVIIHRLERPKLWARCGEGSVHLSRCANGHRGHIRGPLLLFDPSLDFAIFSPAPLLDEAHSRAEGDYLVTQLRGSVTPAERDRSLRRIEVVPREQLRTALESPELNAGDFAPGADIDEDAHAVYVLLRTGDFDLIQKVIESPKAAPALAAALRFEAGMHYSRSGPESPDYEEAIRHFHGALDFYRCDRFPHRWAAVHSELAVTFRLRQQGNPRENLRESVRCSEAALEVFRIDAYPEDFAITQSNRANALLDSKWDRPRSMDLGLGAYRDALKVYNPESYPDDWALVLSNLATGLMERGSPEDLLEAADVLRKSLSVRVRKHSPHDWALTQMNLGLVLRRLPKETSGPSKEKAVEALRAAYEVLHDGGSGAERLAILYNLGSTLVQSGNPAALPEAADLLEQAMAAFFESGDSIELEDCRKNLSRVYLNWAMHAAELRVDICARALRAFEQEQDSEDVAILFHEIARLLLGNSPDGSATDLALQAARRALCILRQKSQVELRAKALCNLGLIYLKQRAKSRALSCFEAALRIFTALEPTPERNEATGMLHVWSTAATQQ